MKTKKPWAASFDLPMASVWLILSCLSLSPPQRRADLSVKIIVAKPEAKITEFHAVHHEGFLQKVDHENTIGRPCQQNFSPCRPGAPETLEGRAFSGTPGHMSESPCESLKRMGISTHASTTAPMRRAGSNRQDLTASRAVRSGVSILLEVAVAGTAARAPVQVTPDVEEQSRKDREDSGEEHDAVLVRRGHRGRGGGDLEGAGRHISGAYSDIGINAITPILGLFRCPHLPARVRPGTLAGGFGTPGGSQTLGARVSYRSRPFCWVPPRMAQTRSYVHGRSAARIAPALPKPA